MPHSQSKRADSAQPLRRQLTRSERRTSAGPFRRVAAFGPHASAAGPAHFWGRVRCAFQVFCTECKLSV